MSLSSQPLLPVLDDAARAAFRGGTPYVLLRDLLGALFDDADLYPSRVSRPMRPGAAKG